VTGKTTSCAVANDMADASLVTDSLLTERDDMLGLARMAGLTFSTSPRLGSSSAICTADNLSLNAPNEPNDPIEFKLV